jgi:hypothetical protein
VRSARVLNSRASNILGMDIVAILLGIVMFAALLGVVYGIDRI